MRGWARLVEELIAEIAKPMPVRRAHQLPALEAHPGRLWHPDADLDGLPVDLLESTVIALAEET